MDEATPVAPVVDQEKAMAEMKEKGKQEIKAFKLFCEMCLTLPDDFLPMTQEQADTLLEPKCQELSIKIREAGLSQKDVENGLNLMYFIGSSTTGRINTFFKNLMRELSFILTGYYEPEKEMSAQELVDKVIELQTK